MQKLGHCHVKLIAGDLSPSPTVLARSSGRSHARLLLPYLERCSPRCAIADGRQPMAPRAKVAIDGGARHRARAHRSGRHVRRREALGADPARPRAGRLTRPDPACHHPSCAEPSENAGSPEVADAAARALPQRVLAAHLDRVLGQACWLTLLAGVRGDRGGQRKPGAENVSTTHPGGAASPC